MNDSSDRFAASARELGLDIETSRFPEGTRTADDAARAIGCDVAQIVKSLVFMAGDQPLLALTSGAKRVDVKKLASAVGAAKVRKADADEARAASGYAIGGTPPFGHPARVRTVIDPHLFTFDLVWAAAGTPDSVFPIGPQQLAELSRADPADFTEDS